jgi:iron complex transport system ATP-binding protein
MSLIEINNLSHKYNSNKDEFHLEIPDWKLNKGDFVSFLGPNGSGKSTLLRIIAGLIEPSGGNVSLDGKTISSYTRKELAKKVAYVPQNTLSLFPFSVSEIVLMGRYPFLNLFGFEKKEDIEIAAESMNLMDVYHLRKKGINELSGGEAQRVFIARALTQKSEVILLDEPNAHLDLKHQLLIFDLLNNLNLDNQITLVLVSHDINLVAIYTKSIVFIDNGKIVGSGNKNEILTAENIKKVFHIETAVLEGKEGNAMNVLINPQVKF